MAATKSVKASTEKKEVCKYPSPYGSHKSMVDESITLPEPFVACKDDDGLYITEKNRLDSGLADPYRNQLPEDRRKKLQEHGL